MIDITCTLVAYDPQGKESAPWGVSITSEIDMIATDGQVIDLTQVRGWIQCPDKTTAGELIRQLSIDPRSIRRHVLKEISGQVRALAAQLANEASRLEEDESR